MEYENFIACFDTDLAYLNCYSDEVSKKDIEVTSEEKVQIDEAFKLYEEKLAGNSIWYRKRDWYKSIYKISSEIKRKFKGGYCYHAKVKKKIYINYLQFTPYLPIELGEDFYKDKPIRLFEQLSSLR